MLRTDEIGFGGLKLTQDTDYFCYGTDAVLLADFASSGKFRTAADLGTNNGIIPLLLSAMTDAEKITGVELQPEAAGLAEENASANGLSDRIEIINADVLDIPGMLPKASFDAVTVNPPYFQAGGGLLSAELLKRAARHEVTASLSDFIKCAAYLLHERGTLYMIHRPSRLADIFSVCIGEKLEPKRMRMVVPHRGDPPNLVLLECRKNGGRELRIMPELAVYDSGGGYTSEVREIYRK
ncbi:MAG: tRNA1(Val) (adenine(37)-N6)-methyltransferase [Anaerovoracaceae bacterium]|jgi:tRNA1Val (adenine37-N6)-methyltransferase